MSRRQQAACQEKQSFDSYSLAERIIKRQRGGRRRKLQGPERLQIYRCKDCGKYHIGNTFK